MSKRTLTVKYFAAKEIDLNFPDDVFTEAEIEGAAKLLAKQNCPDGCEVIDYVWDVKPQPIKAWELDDFERVDGQTLVQDYSEPTPEDLAALREYWDQEEALMLAERD